ncbi:hypothetical protein [Streptomyces sp. NPDC005865]|uniref:hypothetical protein n=1 Tax=Streptomyces sp. NPDC005865 TaxID=3155453 RepID=UPI0033F4951E
MLSAPRGILFWLFLVVVLFLITTAPVQSAHVLADVVHAIGQFFTGLKTFVETLRSA